MEAGDLSRPLGEPHVQDVPFRIDDSGERLVIRDTPWGLWLFGGVFVASGLVTLSIPFVSAAWTGFSAWERLGVMAIGIAHLAGGLWTVGRHGATVVDIDRERGTGSHAARRPFDRAPATTTFRLGDVRAVTLRQSADSDGDPMFALELWLAGSRVLPLQAQPAHGRERAESRAARLRESLGLTAEAVVASNAPREVASVERSS